MENTQITSGRPGDYLHGVSLPLITEGQSYSGTPVQSNIATISASVEQRQVTGGSTPGNGGLGYIPGYLSDTASVYPMVAEDKRGPEGVAATGAKNQTINASEILKDLWSGYNNIDPLQGFYLRPEYKDGQRDLYDAIACRGLPKFLCEAHFDIESYEVRNVLGMIQEFIKPEDQKLFDKCCIGLKKANNVYYDNIKVGKKISLLLQKYGSIGLNKQIERFTECCIKAWGYYNPGHTSTPSREDVFTDSSQLCYDAMYRLVNLLQQPNQHWMDIVVNSSLLRHSCCTLVMTVKFATNAEVKPGVFKETLNDLFPKSIQNPALQLSFEDNDTHNTDGSGLKNFLRCLAGIFCMAT